MTYLQLPLPEEKPVTIKAWRDMGAVRQQCPNCHQWLMYPANVISYAVVCPCGCYTLPNDNGMIVWLHPDVTRDKIKTHFRKMNKNN